MTTTAEQAQAPAWMAGALAKLGRQTITYTVGVLLSRVLAILTLPIYTRLLRPSDYGVLELLSTTIEIVAIVAGAGLSQTVIRFHATCTTDQERRTLFSTAMACVLALACALGGTGVLFAPQLASFVYGDAAYAPHFRLAFTTLAIQAGIELPMVYLQVRQQSTLFVLAGLGRLVVQLGLNIWLVVFAGFGVMGVLYSSLIGSAVLAAALLTYMLRKVGVSFSRQRAAELLRFGAPLIFWALGSFVLTFSDRYFLNHYATLEAVGLYALAYRFGFILSAFAAGPFGLVWDPLRFEILKRPEGKETVRKVFLYFNIALLAAALAMAVFADPLLVLVAAPEYRAAASLVPPILAAYVLQTWTGFMNVGLFMVGKTSTYAVWGVAAAAVATLFNFLLIPTWGAAGAAWATVLAFLFRLIGVYVSSQRAYPLPYAWGRLSLLLGAVGVLGFIATESAHLASVVGSISMGVLAVMLFAVVGYRWGLSSQDRRLIPAAIRLTVGRSAAN